MSEQFSNKHIVIGDVTYVNHVSLGEPVWWEDHHTGYLTRVETRLAAALDHLYAAELGNAQAIEYAARVLAVVAPQCEPSDTVLGLLSQLDNVIAGLRRGTHAVPYPNPVRLIARIAQLEHERNALGHQLATIRDLAHGAPMYTTASNADTPEHVCGRKGFGRDGDVCPACEADAEKRARRREYL